VSRWVRKGAIPKMSAPRRRKRKAYIARTEFTPHTIAYQSFTELYYRQLQADNPTPDALLPLLVFMAFSVEAYVNYIGSVSIPYWDDLERLPGTICWKKYSHIIVNQ